MSAETRSRRQRERDNNTRPERIDALARGLRAALGCGSIPRPDAGLAARLNRYDLLNHSSREI